MHVIPVEVKLRGNQYVADFTVTDFDTGMPVSQALINLAGREASTNEIGKASIYPLEKGTYTFTVTHPDYENYSGSFEAKP